MYITAFGATRSSHVGDTSRTRRRWYWARIPRPDRRRSCRSVRPRGSVGIECRLQPLDCALLQHHHVKTAGRRLAQTHQVVTRGKNNAPLLERADTGSRPAVADAFALAHLNKNASAVRCPHDQVNFSAPTARRPIIANQKAQASLLQIGERGVFGRITQLLACADLSLDLRKNH